VRGLQRCLVRWSFLNVAVDVPTGGAVHGGSPCRMVYTHGTRLSFVKCAFGRCPHDNWLSSVAHRRLVLHSVVADGSFPTVGLGCSRLVSHLARRWTDGHCVRHPPPPLRPPYLFSHRAFEPSLGSHPGTLPPHTTTLPATTARADGWRFAAHTTHTRVSLLRARHPPLPPHHAHTPYLQARYTYAPTLALFHARQTWPVVWDSPGLRVSPFPGSTCRCYPAPLTVVSGGRVFWLDGGAVAPLDNRWFFTFLPPLRHRQTRALPGQLVSSTRPIRVVGDGPK